MTDKGETPQVVLVTGADGVQYMGEFSGAFKETVAPCAVAITALG